MDSLIVCNTGSDYISKISLLKSLDLDFRGSSNQRVIDVKKSLEAGNVVLRSEFI